MGKERKEYTVGAMVSRTGDERQRWRRKRDENSSHIECVLIRTVGVQPNFELSHVGFS